MDARSATDSGVHGMLLSLVLSNTLTADVILCASLESSSVIGSPGGNLDRSIPSDRGVSKLLFE
jgi:hypothetical protein